MVIYQLEIYFAYKNNASCAVPYFPDCWLYGFYFPEDKDEKEKPGGKFCDKLWEKLTAGCEKKWRSGKKVDGVFDPQYFLKETIRKTAISEAYAKRLLDLGKDDDWYCLITIILSIFLIISQMRKFLGLKMK